MNSCWLTAFVEDWRGPSVVAESARNSDWSRSPALVTAVQDVAAGRAARALRAARAEFSLASAQHDGARAGVAAALLRLAEVRQFITLPDGCGAPSEDVAMFWDGRESVARTDQLLKAAQQLPNAQPANATIGWLRFASSLPTIRHLVRGAAAASEIDARLRPMLAMELQEAGKQCRALGVPLASVHFESAKWCWLRGDSRSAQEELERALVEYEHFGDTDGVAACWVLRCEWLLSPLGVATCRNLLLLESSEHGGELLSPAERRERSASLADAGNVDAALTRVASAARGNSASNLLGLLELLSAERARLVRDGKAQREHLERAERFFTESGDEARLRLTLGHRLLAQIDETPAASQPQVAAEIGMWGREDGSYSYAWGIGLMFSRVGRQALTAGGDYEKAQACFRLALTLNEALGAKHRVAQSHDDLADLHRLIGHRERVRYHQQTAFDTLTEVVKVPSAPRSALLKAKLLLHRMFAEGLALRDVDAMQSALARSALLPAGMDQTVKIAERAIEESARQAKVLVPLYRAVRCRAECNNQAAERYFDEAAAEAGQMVGSDGLFLRAMVLGTRRAYDEALAVYDEYLKAGGFLQRQQWLLSQAAAADPEQYEQQAALTQAQASAQNFQFYVRVKASERARREFKALEATSGPGWYEADPRPWLPLCDIGEMHEQLGEHEAALGAYERALEALETRRDRLTRDELKVALSGGEGPQYLYFFAVRAALKLARSSARASHDAKERAFLWSERARARALLDLRAAHGARDDAADVLSRWRRLTTRNQVWLSLLLQLQGKEGEDVSARRAEIEENLKRGEAEASQLEREVSLSYPALASEAGRSKVVSLAELTAMLDGGTAVLHYMTLGDELISWVVTRDGMIGHEVRAFGTSSLAAKVRTFHRLCAEGAELVAVRRASEELAAILLGPYAATIDACERLIFMPYGDLHRVPFSALRWKEGWLGEAKPLSQVPSASLLALLRRTDAPARERSLLAVGNPANMMFRSELTQSERSLTPLRGAELEARHAANQFGTKPLLGHEATLSRVMEELPRHQLLLFASHAVFDADAPLLSGVALADGEFLTVERLLALRISPDVVALSACETGLGAMTGGEELVGLSRGMLAAGARCLVVSLWPVLDQSTSVLMSRFFDGLKMQLPPSDALRMAQVGIRAMSAQDLTRALDKLRDVPGETTTSVQPSRVGEHPQRWAAFTVVGAGF